MSVSSQMKKNRKNSINHLKLQKAIWIHFYANNVSRDKKNPRLMKSMQKIPKTSACNNLL